jgi:hypothetical protein
MKFANNCAIKSMLYITFQTTVIRFLNRGLMQITSRPNLYEMQIPLRFVTFVLSIRRFVYVCLTQCTIQLFRPKYYKTSPSQRPVI